MAVTNHRAIASFIVRQVLRLTVSNLLSTRGSSRYVTFFESDILSTWVVCFRSVHITLRRLCRHSLRCRYLLPLLHSVQVELVGHRLGYAIVSILKQH